MTPYPEAIVAAGPLDEREAWRSADAKAGRDARGRATGRSSEQAEDGARCVLSALYAAHAGRIVRFLRDLLGDSALAADATQETFARAFRRIDTLQDPQRAAAWLFGIARNVASEQRRARRRSQAIFLPSEAENEGADAPRDRSPEAQMLGREATAVIARAMEALSEDRRAALALRVDHGLAYDEIAEILGWSLAKVKVEIFRAREVLREAMQQYEGGTR